MKKRLAIYPFDKENSCFARYRHMIPGYEVASLIGLKGWQQEGLDASVVDGGDNIGIKITEDFENAIRDVDTVLFLDGFTDIRIEVYKKKIDVALSLQKEIVVTKTLCGKFESAHIDTSSFLKLPTNQASSQDLLTEQEGLSIYNISVPIIMVFGCGEHTNKFEVQLALRENFLSDGYKVISIGTKQYSSLFQMEQVPDFLYQSNLKFEEKVVAFNRYLYRIETEQNPDVIVIGVPGGIMSLSNRCPNHFGEMAYLFGCAVQSDIGITSLYYEAATTQEYLSEINKYGWYALKSCMNYFNISHFKRNYNLELGTEEYLCVDNERVNNYVKKHYTSFSKENLHVFNCMDKMNMRSIYDKIISKLSENADVIG